MLSLWLNVPKLSDGARKEKSGEVGTASAKGLRQRESEEPVARKQALRGLAECVNSVLTELGGHWERP